ncbi:MAG: hypothetical protein HYS60_01355 [Candidatus Wildermuthbacteria bacterium]|nr:hypothetical protein [Candidatus Wildermuthbacteria bacterium]
MLFNGKEFSEKARRVLSLAQEEARRRNHTYIGTEHIILGLIGVVDGVATKVLSNLGVESEKVRSAVDFILSIGEQAFIGEFEWTQRAKKVIELATEEARRVDRRYISTGHLLIGLIREGEGVAASVLDSLGITLEKVRSETAHVDNNEKKPLGELSDAELDDVIKRAQENLDNAQVILDAFQRIKAEREVVEKKGAS